MDKIIPICILLGTIIIGFISKVLELSAVVKRIEFTDNYRKMFVDYINEIISKNSFNQKLYHELTSNVKEIQRELGEDGIFAYMTNNLKGVAVRDYQLLINFLPETRNMINNNSILHIRYNQSIHDCDDMFIRHLGTLECQHNKIRKGLFNPFSSFAEGVKAIILLPLFTLNWFGFVSAEKAYKARDNLFVKVLNFFVAILGFIGTIITIVVGWNDFWKIVA